MAENEFTLAHHNDGISSQVILDAGLNVFALQLLIESFTDVAKGETKKVRFVYRGVWVTLEIADLEQLPVDILTVPTDELRSDLDACYADILNCEAALKLKQKFYAGAPTQKVIDENRAVAAKIKAELDRREAA